MKKRVFGGNRFSWGTGGTNSREKTKLHVLCDDVQYWTRRGGGKGPPNDRGEFFAVRCTLLMYCTVGSNMAQNAARAAVESH